MTPSPGVTSIKVIRIQVFFLGSCQKYLTFWLGFMPIFWHNPRKKTWILDFWHKKKRFGQNIQAYSCWDPQVAVLVFWLSLLFQALAVIKNLKKIIFGNCRKPLLLCTYTLIILAKFWSKPPITILNFVPLWIAQSRKGIFSCNLILF